MDESGTADIFLMCKLLCVAISIKFICVCHYKQKLYLTMFSFKNYCNPSCPRCQCEAANTCWLEISHGRVRMSVFNDDVSSTKDLCYWIRWENHKWKKRHWEVIDAIFYMPAAFSPRMTDKNHQNCQYSE